MTWEPRNFCPTPAFAQDRFFGTHSPSQFPYQWPVSPVSQGIFSSTLGHDQISLPVARDLSYTKSNFRKTRFKSNPLPVSCERNFTMYIFPEYLTMIKLLYQWPEIPVTQVRFLGILGPNQIPNQWPVSSVSQGIFSWILGHDKITLPVTTYPSSPKSIFRNTQPKSSPLSVACEPRTTTIFCLIPAFAQDVFPWTTDSLSLVCNPKTSFIFHPSSALLQRQV